MIGIPTFGRKNGAYTAGRFVFEFDYKKPIGVVNSIEGGSFRSDPVPSTVGGQFTVTKYPGRPKYDDITITVGMAMSPAFWEWVKASLDNKPERRSGAVVGYDFDNQERSRRTFTNALISEISFPTLEALPSNANPGLITIKISPERLEYKDGDRSPLIQNQALNEYVKQKMWLTSNFTIGLDRFKGDESLRKVKIEAFTIKQNIIDNPVGAELEPRKEVGRLELPQLQISFAEAYAKNWMDWYKKSVVEGNYSETPGALTFLPPNNDVNNQLMRLDLDGVGLTSLEFDKYEAGKPAISRVKASLYVESIRLMPGAGNA